MPTLLASRHPEVKAKHIPFWSGYGPANRVICGPRETHGIRLAFFSLAMAGTGGGLVTARCWLGLLWEWLTASSPG